MSDQPGIDDFAFGQDALSDETGRLDALTLLDARSRTSESGFRHVTSAVCLALGLDMSAVTLIGKTRQYINASQGLTLSSCGRDVAFCNHTIRAYRPLIVPDTHADSRFRDNPLVTAAPFLRSYAGHPLTTREGYNIGALCVLGLAPRHFESNEIALLGELSKVVVEQLELRALADTDGLTGLLTRRSFLREVGNALHREGTASIAVIDIDHFKRINDTHGHPAGDNVLREFAAILQEEARHDHVVGRLGGEEFAVLLPGTDPDSARTWAERARRRIEQHRFAAPLGLQLTMSAGLAGSLRAVGDTPEAFIARADKPLYEAKRSGRNRLVAA